MKHYSWFYDGLIEINPRKIDYQRQGNCGTFVSKFQLFNFANQKACTQKIIRNSEWSIERMLYWQFSYIHFFTRYFFNFEEVLANNCGYFKIHNTGLLWKKRKLRPKGFHHNLNVIDKTLETFLWQIFESVDFLPAAPPSDRFCSKFTFLKRKKTFLCLLTT